MKLSLINDEYSQDLLATLEFAAENKIDEIELRSAWDKHCLDFDDCELTDCKKMADDTGVSYSVLNTFLCKCEFSDASGFEDSILDTAKRYVDIAVKLGIPSIRIFAFWKDTAPHLDSIVEKVSAINEIAEDGEIAVLVENGTFSSVGSGSKLDSLLDSVDNTNVTALWDPGNVLNGGWDEPIDIGARTLNGKISHVHVKNPHRRSDNSLHFGHLIGGLIDWAAHIKLLDQLGYKGDLSLETHWRIGKELHGRETLDFPTGDSFSSNGCEATAYSLDELRNILAITSNG